MAKYWKLIVVALITVFSFALFYIDVGSVSTQFPHFKINNIAGDVKEVEDVQVEGHLYFEMYYNGGEFQIDTLGTTYYRDTSYFKLPYEHYTSPKTEKLIENHRNFMRGKNMYPTYYYEDEDVLAYANETYSLGSDEFVIDVVDKVTNKSTGFSVKIPNRTDYWYIDIEKVLVRENLLYIIAQNEPSENMDSEVAQNLGAVVNVYTIDLTTEEVVDVTSIDALGGFKSSANINGYVDLNVVYPEVGNDSEFIVTVNKTTYGEPEQSDNYSSDEYEFENIKTDRIIKYDIETQEQTVIELEEDHQLGVLIHYEEEIASFVGKDNQDTIFKQIDLKNNKVLVEKVHTFDRAIISDYDFLYAPIKDNKLYALQSYNETNQAMDVPLFVINLADFEIAYQGEITLSDSYVPERGMYYYFNGIYFKE